MANSENESDNFHTIGAKLPALADHVRQLALSKLQQYITELLDSCDDLFYDLSSRATSNQEQSLYFESMREIRIKRESIQQQFRELFIESFNSPRSEASSSHQSLSLVHHDELEVNVALMNMYGRANDVYKEDLHDLNIRLGHLVPFLKANPSSNPLNPEPLCRSFTQACQSHLEISIKPLIILLKQFERFALKRLGQIYGEANQLLLDSGIVPKIEREVSKSKSTYSKPRLADKEDEILDEVMRQQTYYGLPLARSYDGYQASFTLSEFSSLIDGVRKGEYQFRHYTPYTNNPGELMPASELIKLLNKAQEVLNQQGKGELTQPYLHKVTSKLLSSRNPEEPQRVSQSNDDVINLVAMFFEFILDDNSIALALRNQISRLQIPILKLALRDSTFFSDTNHPARQLINTIAAVGVIYDEARDLKKDKVFLAIADMVQTICHQHSFDDNIFNEMLPDLEKIIDKEQRRSAIVEKRTSQTEIGKSQVKTANKTARAFLVKKLHKVQLPEEIRDFLIERWLNVLIMTVLKHSEKSEEWQKASQVVNDVIWCCQALNSETELARLKKLLPSILSSFEEGLQMLGDQKDSISRELGIIESILSRSEAFETNEISQEEEDLLAEIPQQEGETAIQRQQKELQELSGESIEQGDRIRPGDWVHYRHPKTQKMIRCKLSAKIKSADTYLFVNRLGLKVIEVDRHSFAYDLQKGNAKVIVNTPFFDRMLDKVFNNLKQASNS